MRTGGLGRPGIVAMAASGYNDDTTMSLDEWKVKEIQKLVDKWSVTKGYTAYELIDDITDILETIQIPEE